MAELNLPAPDPLPAVGLPFHDLGRELCGCRTGGPHRQGCGLDCYGLIRVLYRQIGLELPLYGDVYASTRERARIAAHVHATAAEWRAIAAGQERAWDVVVLRLLGRPIHLGLVLRPGEMVHSDPACGVAVERYGSPVWRHRVEAFYRRPELVGA
jgi:cell wall-associated NlpC family hydrolase